MLPKEIMLRTGTRTKATFQTCAFHPHALSSVTFAKKLLNPGSLSSLLLKVLAHLADCPPVPDPARHEAPRFHRGARGSPVASRTLLVAAYGSSRATHCGGRGRPTQEVTRWTEGSGSFFQTLRSERPRLERHTPYGHLSLTATA